MITDLVQCFHHFGLWFRAAEVLAAVREDDQIRENASILLLFS